MRVVTASVGVPNRPDFQWPEDWPIPAEGQSLSLNDVPGPLEVRTVQWLPLGDDDHPEPFVYIVIGPPRREW